MSLRQEKELGGMQEEFIRAEAGACWCLYQEFVVEWGGMIVEMFVGRVGVIWLSVPYRVLAGNKERSQKTGVPNVTPKQRSDGG